MKILDIIKNNAKLYMIMGIIILLGTMGVTAALTISSFNAIAIDTTSSVIDANITYDEGTNTAEVINNGNLLPISDDLVSLDTIDTRVLKVKFNVSGVDSNPDNTIYDVAMYFDELDCELRTTDLKWRLYKNDSLLSEGNLSPTFDTINNNRLVLTNTQEDLTTQEDKYTFLLWISESCTGDITQCDSSMDQSKYLDRVLNGSIKIELSTKNKKELVRVTGEEGSCNYTEVDVPVCNNLTYNASSQILVNSNDKYRLINNTGVNAGSYNVTLELEDGYKWSDGSTDNRVISCDIDKYDVTVTTLNQNITYGSGISSSLDNIDVSKLLDEHTVTSVLLSAGIYEVGIGTISASNLLIIDTEENDVTNNYDIHYNNAGKINIGCLNMSVMPSASNVIYNGEKQSGIIGGDYIDISGTVNAVNIGDYSVTVVPQKNYCWEDGSTDTKSLDWKIYGYISTITLDSQNADVIGKTEIYSSDGKKYLDEKLSLEMTISENNIEVPSRENYTFEGYYTGEDGSGTMMINSEGYVTEELLSSETDAILYAYWIGDEYTLYMNPYFGTTSDSGWTLNDGYNYDYYTKKVRYGDLYGNLPSVTKEGYTFDGWYNWTTEKENFSISASSSSNYNYIGVAWNIYPGVTYTITMDSAEVTEGSATEFTTVIFDWTDNKGLSSVTTTFGDNISYKITCPSTADPTHNIVMLLYSGKVGSTAGIATSYTGVKFGSNGTTLPVKYSADSIVSVAGNQLLKAYYKDDIGPEISSVSSSTTYDQTNYVSFTATDVGSGVAYYNITTDASEPVSWIPVVSEVESSTETKQEYGASWARVFHHDNHYGDVYFSDETEAKSSNTVDKYSVLGNLENYRNNNGQFEFLLEYPGIDGYNRWIQTANPITTSIENSSCTAVSGYSPVTMSWTDFCFGGLALSTTTDALLDGMTGHSYWYYAIGAYYNYSGGMPGPYDGTTYHIVPVVDLWTRIDDREVEPQTTVTKRIGNIKENGTYYVWVKDTNGNVSYETVEVSKIDNKSPSINTYVGKILYTDPEFSSGTNGIDVYNNKQNGTVTITRKAISGIPNSSGYGLEIVTSGSAAPYHGGFYFATQSAANKQFVVAIRAKIPSGHNIQWGSNAIGDDWSGGWASSQAGTGDWEDYIYIVNCGSSGTFSTTNFFYLDFGDSTATSTPVTWQVAYATVIDTTIDGKDYIITDGWDSASGVTAYGYTSTLSFQSVIWTDIDTQYSYLSKYSFSGNGTYYSWFKDAAGNISYRDNVISNLPVYTVTTQYYYKYNHDTSYTYFDTRTNSVVEGDSFTPYSITAPNGFHLVSWYNIYDSNSNSLGSGTTNSTAFTVTQDTIVHVHYYPDEYTVSYNANGGSGAPASQTKYYGTTLTLSSTVPTRTSYTFLGWSTSSTATSASYAAGGSYTVNSDATLYAVWKGNTYTISYNANGGSGAPSSHSYTYASSGTTNLSSTIPTRAGYTFLGWSLSSTATSASYSAGQAWKLSNASNYMLYAVWKDNVAPTCSLSVTSSGVVFASKSDNVGVSSYGMATSSTANYSGGTSLALSAGTKYGFVKDDAGNTGSCSVTIAATTTSDTTPSCTSSNYSSPSSACSAGTTYITNSCSTSTLYKGTRYICQLSSSATSGTCYCNNGTTDIGLTGTYSSTGKCKTDCINKGYSYSYVYGYAFENAGTFTGGTSWHCTAGQGMVDTCNATNSGKYYRECTAYTGYSGTITCRSFSCPSGYTKLNNSWCYAY